jgi:glucosamine-6-phosphate deaminase
VEVVIVQDAATAAAVVAMEIIALVKRKPDALLGLATGSTALAIYHALAPDVANGDSMFARSRGCLLDEYLGLPPAHPQSYYSFVLREVVGPLGMRPEAVLVPDTFAADVPGACADYERAIREAGGVDLQLLGIGGDGHIGFNEPCSSLASRTRVKTLTAQTRMDNSRFFDRLDDVPRHVITQGIATILDSRHAMLMATGEAKAKALAQAIEGPVSSFVPASALQLHPHATIVIDEAAASGLTLAHYFAETYAAKPTWQGL